MEPWEEGPSVTFGHGTQTVKHCPWLSGRPSSVHLYPDPTNPSSAWRGRNLVIVTVGLPGNHRALYARKIARYLGWCGLQVRLFSLQGYRTAAINAPLSVSDLTDPDAVEVRHSTRPVEGTVHPGVDALSYRFIFTYEVCGSPPPSSACHPFPLHPLLLFLFFSLASVVLFSVCLGHFPLLTLQPHQRREELADAACISAVEFLATHGARGGAVVVLDGVNAVALRRERIERVMLGTWGSESRSGGGSTPTGEGDRGAASVASNAEAGGDGKGSAMGTEGSDFESLFATSLRVGSEAARRVRPATVEARAKFGAVVDADRFLYIEVGAGEEDTDDDDGAREGGAKASGGVSGGVGAPVIVGSASGAGGVGGGGNVVLQLLRAMYEKVCCDTRAVVRVVGGCDDVELSNIAGFLPSKVSAFVPHINPRPQKVFLSRHGQSQFNTFGQLGGDSALTANGAEYGKVLAEWVRANASPGFLEIWCSTMVRTRQTVAPLAADGVWSIRYWPALEEVSAGVCDGFTYRQVADVYPAVAAARAADKFGFRYPYGESYADLCARVEPVLLALMRSKVPVLVVAHQAVLRVLYAFFTDTEPQKCTRVAIPLHTLFSFPPTADGRNEASTQLLLPLPEGSAVE